MRRRFGLPAVEALVSARPRLVGERGDVGSVLATPARLAGGLEMRSVMSARARERDRPEFSIKAMVGRTLPAYDEIRGEESLAA